MRLKLVLLGCAVVILCFLMYAERPYAVTSDSGFQVWSAQQYAGQRVSTVNTLRLVNPRDLSRDVECPLLAWSPTGAWMFYWAYRLGVAPGTSARLFALMLSLIGAAGWAWIAWRIGLRGWWAAAAVTVAALYCLRTGLNDHTGTEDYLVYAVAPWLLEGAFLLAAKLRGGLRPAVMIQATILCAALGAVYWLKYAGIFFSAAVLGAMALDFLRDGPRRRLAAWLPLLALGGAAFAAPVLAQKLSSRTSGADLVATGLARHRDKPLQLFGGYVRDAVYSASTVLFTAEPGVTRLAETGAARRWLGRVPGLLLLLVLVWAMRKYPDRLLRNLALLMLASPLAAFPILSFLTRTRFTYSLQRCCEPYWIFLELTILLLLSQRPGKSGVPANTRAALAVLTAIQLALFIWGPSVALRQAWKWARAPKYEVSETRLFVKDLTNNGTPPIDAQVQRLVHSPGDVIVPAIYSNHGFGSDVCIELDRLGRLLPLTYFPVATPLTQGDGANFYGSSPFRSSKPVRVILVATDPYHRGDFRQSVQHIRERFGPAQWTEEPHDSTSLAWIWTAELQPAPGSAIAPAATPGNPR
jgi:hypothetical protein